MPNETSILILSVDRVDGDAVVVGFTDGSSATYTIEELLALRPDRTEAEEDEASENG